MNMEIETERKPHLFYGWWIVAAGFVVVGYGAGIINLIVSQLYSFIRELGGTASQSTVAMTIFSVISTISLLAIGPLIDRYGPRKLMFIGITVTSITILGLPYADNPPYILLGTLAIGMSAGFLLPVQTSTANWFMKRRSIALAVICAAPILGRFVVNLLGNQIADQVGLSKSSFLGLGSVMLIIGIPLALAIRHRPEQHGCMPDGRVEATKETVQAVIEKDTHLAEVNFTLRQVLRTKAFWMLTIAMGLITGMGYFAAFRSLYLIERGLDIKTDANIFELAPLMGLVWMLLFGFLGDKFPKRYLLAIAIALQSISVLVLMAAGSKTTLYLYMLVFGFGSGRVPLILAIRADYFGRKSFATITVIMGLFSGIISVGFPSFGGWILDITGSYQTFFLLSMLIGFIAAVMFFFAKPPESPQKVSAEIES
jgi:MFS family permease